MRPRINSGVAVFDPGGVCPAPPAGYEDFTDLPPLVMTGSLEGCWYTKILTTKDNGAPSGIYQERGEEVFVGSLNGGPAGTFATTYKFTCGIRMYLPARRSTDAASTRSLTAAAPVAAGATGQVDFKDEVTTGEFLYRGHITRDTFQIGIKRRFLMRRPLLVLVALAVLMLAAAPAAYAQETTITTAITFPQEGAVRHLHRE